MWKQESEKENIYQTKFVYDKAIEIRHLKINQKTTI